jgi:ABC-type polysaccharide/polyol phosphate transport system ATPase subunit
MSDVAIRVENLSKKYYIGGKQERYKTLRDTLTDAFILPFRKAGRLLRGHATGAAGLYETIWALKDVSFEVKQGEVIGIIGRNGAGKSTLLKILSRITEPTEGYADIYGRVGSLLEVGTGFHSELTGRENIYLNAAILGMKKMEIDQKFDEIVAFAEVEKFIDTPVKHYSTGMYLRLAFAVAAHLEPEILVVDEVLAVGDTEFQRKCLGKMDEVSKEGRTVLFVSHNMGAISTLCNKSIFLESGKVAKYDVTSEVIPLYFGTGSTSNFEGITVCSYMKNGSTIWEKGTDIAIEVSWEKYRFLPGWQIDISFYTLEGTILFYFQSHKIKDFPSNDPEKNSVTFFIENVGFAKRPLRLDVGIRKGRDMPYDVCIQNSLILNPGGNNLPVWQGMKDLIVVPNISFNVDAK